MYPIYAGVEDATNRINRLLNDGHHSEALAASRESFGKLLDAMVAELNSNGNFFRANGASHPSLGQRPRKSSAKTNKG
jgi:hypothetical protein